MLICDVKVWQLWMSCIRSGSRFRLIFAQMLLNPVALRDSRAKLLHGGQQSGPTGPRRANGISSVPSLMLNGRGCPRTSMSQYVQKPSVQFQASTARHLPPHNRQLLRHTIRGQQVNGDPHQVDHPPALR